MLNLFRDRSFWEGDTDKVPAPIIGEWLRKRYGTPRPPFITLIDHTYGEPIGPQPAPLPFVPAELPRVVQRPPWDGRTKKNSRKRKAREERRIHYVEERPKLSAWMHAFPGCDPEYG